MVLLTADNPCCTSPKSLRENTLVHLNIDPSHPSFPKVTRDIHKTLVQLNKGSFKKDRRKSYVRASQQAILLAPGSFARMTSYDTLASGVGIVLASGIGLGTVNSSTVSSSVLCVHAYEPFLLQESLLPPLSICLNYMRHQTPISHAQDGISDPLRPTGQQTS